MYSTESVISLITAGTNYPVEVAKTREIAVKHKRRLPIIYVGVKGIEGNNSPNLLSNYIQGGELLQQFFDVQICCEQKDLVVVWRKVYQSLQGKNPDPKETGHTPLVYRQGMLMGIENTNLWWLDQWVLNFPALNLFTF